MNLLDRCTFTSDPLPYDPQYNTIQLQYGGLDLTTGLGLFNLVPVPSTPYYYVKYWQYGNTILSTETDPLDGTFYDGMYELIDVNLGGLFVDEAYIEVIDAPGYGLDDDFDGLGMSQELNMLSVQGPTTESIGIPIRAGDSGLFSPGAVVPSLESISVVAYGKLESSIRLGYFGNPYAAYSDFAQAEPDIDYTNDDILSETYWGPRITARFSIDGFGISILNQATGMEEFLNEMQCQEMFMDYDPYAKLIRFDFSLVLSTFDMEAFSNYMLDGNLRVKIYLATTFEMKFESATYNKNDLRTRRGSLVESWQRLHVTEVETYARAKDTGNEWQLNRFMSFQASFSYSPSCIDA
nr:hypothetical protein [Candidatus Sigynarchaeota archaeon]